VAAGVALIASWVVLDSCGREPDAGATSEDAATADTASRVVQEPQSVTLEQFASLSWLEGDWRGTLPDGNGFFERYRVTSDSTISMHAFPDSTMGAPSDSSRIYWRDGRVYSESARSRSVVAHLGDGEVRFVPDGARGYHYTWARVEGGWNATLHASGGGREVIYEMRPVGPAR
jgi:hypothetical protein